MRAQFKTLTTSNCWLMLVEKLQSTTLPSYFMINSIMVRDENSCFPYICTHISYTVVKFDAICKLDGTVMDIFVKISREMELPLKFVLTISTEWIWVIGINVINDCQN